MCSEKHSGIHKDINPDATAEQIAEWEKMIEELEERSKNTKENGANALPTQFAPI